MSAVIETNRGDFHIEDDPRAARAELRAAAGIGAGAVFITVTARQPVAIHYSEVRRIRSAHEPPRWRRKLRNWALFTAGMLLTTAGVLGLCLGGSALVATIFGHADQITTPWLVVIPGLAAFYGGGWVASEAASQLGID